MDQEEIQTETRQGSAHKSKVSCCLNLRHVKFWAYPVNLQAVADFGGVLRWSAREKLRPSRPAAVFSLVCRADGVGL
jgi:hypothetical protein